MPSAAIAPRPMAVVREVRAQHVAAVANVRGLARDLVVPVRSDCTAAAVELLEAREIHRLADRRDDEVGRDVLLGAFGHLDLEAPTHDLGFAPGNPQRDRAAARVLDHADRRQSAANRDALGGCLLDLVPVGLHAVDAEHRRQRHLGTVLGRHRRRVVREVPADGEFRKIGGMRVLDVAEASRHRRDVDGGIAAADDDDAPADVPAADHR